MVFEARKSDFEGVLPGSMVSHVFVYRRPQCGFTRLEKQVLERAADHLTDEEFSSALGIKPGAVAPRWRSIYARVAEHVPSWLDAGASVGSAARGKERRQRVIAFVTEHPEALRPYHAGQANSCTHLTLRVRALQYTRKSYRQNCFAS